MSQLYSQPYVLYHSSGLGLEQGGKKRKNTGPLFLVSKLSLSPLNSVDLNQCENR